MQCWYWIRISSVVYSLYPLFIIPNCPSKLQFDVVLCSSLKLYWLMVPSYSFRSLASPHCTLSSVPLEATKPRHLDLELSLLSGLLLVLGWRLAALVCITCANSHQGYYMLFDCNLSICLTVKFVLVLQRTWLQFPLTALAGRVEGGEGGCRCLLQAIFYLLWWQSELTPPCGPTVSMLIRRSFNFALSRIIWC
jgi:hypothetical protein